MVSLDTPNLSATDLKQKNYISGTAPCARHFVGLAQPYIFGFFELNSAN